MNRHIFLGFLAVALAACGPEPKSADRPDPSLGAPMTPNPADSSVNPGTGTPAAAGASDDMSRGTAAVKAGDWTTARTQFETAVSKNPKNADAWYYLGLVMDKTGDKGAAEKDYKQALTVQPDHDAAKNLVAIYVESQRYDDAIALAKQSLAKNSKDTDMQLNYAVALSGKGDVDGASRAFEDALKLAPNDARFYVAYADHLAAAKKTDDAVAKLKQALRVANDDPVMLGTIGFSFRTARDIPDCISTFDKAIGLKDNADFRTNRALCKLANKDKSGAQADFQAAVDKEPSFGPAHYWLGSILHDDGKFADAAAQYDAYLKVDPKGPMSKKAAEKLALAKDKKKPEKKK